MTVAFVCPDNFKDYKAVEKELLKYLDISKIICATTNSNQLAEGYCLNKNITLWLVKDGGKERRLRTMIERADKVILFEFTDYDENKTKYSRTQYALKYAQKLGKDLQIINYNRLEEAQKQLNELYYEYFVTRAKKEFGTEILSKLSTPFLIKIPKNYFKNKRIWYVGQDTFKWYGMYEEAFLKNEDPVQYAINAYKSFFLNPKNTLMWRYRDNIFRDNKDAVIYNNIYKCDHIEGYEKWYTASNMITQKGHLKKLEKLIALQDNVFKKEIEILKPELVLLMTSHNQDEIAFQKCTDSKIISKPVDNIVSAKELGKIESDFLPEETYRTYHPAYLNRMKQEKKDFIIDFLQKKVSQK